MNDQGFHEIQLSGKQLVFLFMSAVVVAVVIFLLGVSVGRGVRGAVGNASAADLGAPTDTTAAAVPAGTKVTPADLDYREKLQGQGAAGSGSTAAAAGAAAGAALGAASNSASTAAKPAETPATPAATPAAPATTPADTKPPTSTPSKRPNLLAMTNDPSTGKPATPTPAATPKPPSTKPATPPPNAKPTSDAAQPPKTDSGWIVQLNAFGTKNAADSFIRELKAKGYSAYSVNTATLFKVRMGPFVERAEADAMASRLKKDGYKPLVTR